MFAGWLHGACLSKGNHMRHTFFALSAAAALALTGTAYAAGPGGHASTTGAAHASTNSAASSQSTSPTTNSAPTTNAAPSTTTLRGPAQTGQPGAECGSPT